MATKYQFVRGTETENDNYVGPEGSLSVDLENDELRLHDGNTAGGTAMQKKEVTTSTGTQTVADALDSRTVSIQTIDELSEVDVTKIPSGTTVSVKGSPFTLNSEGSWEPQGYVTIWAFGGVGDGQTDDTEAVRRAVQSEIPLFWGHPWTVWRVTEEIAHTYSESAQWRSCDAEIIMDGGSHQRRVLHLLVGKGCQSLEGTLVINANRKAHTGLSILCDSSKVSLSTSVEDLPSVSVPNVVVKNVYRASTEFTGGNGIYVSGGFSTTNLRNAKVFNSGMAEGAEVIGSQGIFGITVGRSTSTGESLFTDVGNIFIDHVYSEDPNYGNDQDGIRIFTRYQQQGSEGSPNKASFVLGGVIRNARNRSAKLQVSQGFIKGLRVEKDSSVIPAGFIANDDIETQGSGVDISGLEFDYRGVFPEAVIRGELAAGNDWAGSHIRGVRGFIDLRGTDITGESFTLLRLQNASGSPSNYTTTLKDVVVRGPINTIARLNASFTGSNTLKLEDITADCKDQWVRNVGGDSADVEITAINQKQTGAPIPFTRRYRGNRRVSGFGNSGFEESLRGDFESAMPLGLRTQLLPLNGSQRHGPACLLSYEVYNDEVISLPNPLGFQGQTSIISVTVASSRNDCGIFSCDNFGVTKIAGGDNLETGSSSEPSSGNFRLWSEGSSGGIQIANRSGTRRVIDVWVVG